MAGYGASRMVVLFGTGNPSIYDYVVEDGYPLSHEVNLDSNGFQLAFKAERNEGGDHWQAAHDPNLVEFAVFISEKDERGR